MDRLRFEFHRLVDDERGGDAIEYALVSGLIVLLFLGGFIQMADGVAQTFNNIETAIVED